jgi:YVTN family beta-propeller protein
MKVIFLLMSALTAFALDFPMSLAMAPDGRVLVLNAGAKASIGIVNGPDLPLPDAFLGLTFALDGKTVYAGGGSRGVVYELTYAAGELKLAREIKASDFVGDVALSPDGRLIYAADLYANLIVVINPQSGRVIDRFKTGRRPYRILFHPDGRSYFVSSWADAAVYHYNTTNGEEIGRIRLGPHATDMVLSAYQPELEEGQSAASWKYRLFVAA